MICVLDYPAEKFAGYNHTADADIDPTWYDVPWDIETIKTDGISHSTSTNPAEITFLKAGYYQVDFRVGIYSYTGNTRSEAEAIVQVDTGSGFANVTGTYTNSYHRQSSQGRGACHINLLMYFNAGDKIKVQVETRSGSNLRTLADASAVNIIEIK